jgi:hypothetical protein
VHASGRSGGAEEESSSLMTGHGESVCLSRRESRRFLKNRVLLFYYTYLLPERTFLMEGIFMNCQYNSFRRDSDTAALSATDVSRALGERSGRPIYQLSFHVQEEVARTPCMQGRAAGKIQKSPCPHAAANPGTESSAFSIIARARGGGKLREIFFFFDCLLAFVAHARRFNTISYRKMQTKEQHLLFWHHQLSHHTLRCTLCSESFSWFTPAFSGS